jgi:hypothetical protein
MRKTRLLSLASIAIGLAANIPLIANASPPASDCTLTISPNPIVRGQTATVSWTHYYWAATAYLPYAYITGYGLVNPFAIRLPDWTFVGSITVSPTSTTTYTMNGPYYSNGTYVGTPYPYACSATLTVNP